MTKDKAYPSFYINRYLHEVTMENITQRNLYQSKETLLSEKLKLHTLCPSLPCRTIQENRLGTHKSTLAHVACVRIWKGVFNDL
jgi:hypothetical protein